MVTFKGVFLIKGVFTEYIFPNTSVAWCVNLHTLMVTFKGVFLIKGVFTEHIFPNTSVACCVSLHTLMVTSEVCNRSTSFQWCVYDKVCSLTHHGVF